MFQNKWKLGFACLLVIFFSGWLVLRHSFLRYNANLVVVPSVIKDADLLRGETLHRRAYVQNQGSTTWELIAAIPSCGCIQASVYPTTLAPRRSSTITVSVATGGTDGQKIVLLSTEWRNKGNPIEIVSINLPIVMTVRSLFVIQPDHLDLGDVSWSTLQSDLKFNLKKEHSNRKWNTIGAIAPWANINVLSEDQEDFRIIVRPKSNKPSYGYYDEPLEITAKQNDVSVGPTCTIPIKAWIDPGVKVTPRTLFSQTLSAGQTYLGLLSITKEEKNFHLISIASPDPAFLSFDCSKIKDGNIIAIPYKMKGVETGSHVGVALVTIRLGTEIRRFALPFISFVKLDSIATKRDISIANVNRR